MPQTKAAPPKRNVCTCTLVAKTSVTCFDVCGAPTYHLFAILSDLLVGSPYQRVVEFDTFFTCSPRNVLVEIKVKVTAPVLEDAAFRKMLAEVIKVWLEPLSSKEPHKVHVARNRHHARRSRVA